VSSPFPIRVYPDAAALGDALALEILAGVRAASGEDRRYLLGCPGGRSLRSTYDALAAHAGAEEADLRGLTIVMMDDYLAPDGDGWRRVDPALHYSCERFAFMEIAGPLNAAVPVGLGVPRDRVWLPDPHNPDAYDGRIERAGGVDMFLVASGASDGHVAFVPPGSSLDAGTSIIPIAETTRRDNLVTFPDFRSLDDVPTHGISVGLGSIRRLSKSVRLVMHGPGKRHATGELLARADFDPEWPASFLHRCPDPALLLDRLAAGREDVNLEPAIASAPPANAKGSDR